MPDPPMLIGLPHDTPAMAKTELSAAMLPKALMCSDLDDMRNTYDDPNKYMVFLDTTREETIQLVGYYVSGSGDRSVFYNTDHISNKTNTKKQQV